MQNSKAIIAVGFGSLVVILIAISIIGFFHIGSINNEFDTLADTYHNKSSASYEMRLATRERLISLTTIANLEDPFARDTEMLHFNRIGTRFANARIELMQYALEPQEQELLDSQAQATSIARPVQEQFLDVAFAGNSAEAQRLLIDEIMPAQHVVIDLIKKLHIVQEEIYYDTLDSLSNKYGNSFILFISLLAVATIAAGSIIATFVIRKIVRTENALFKEKERYALAVRGANDGLWDWDLETNEVYFSPRWKDMLGYEEHEMPNKLDQWFNRIHPEDSEETLAKLNAHLNGLSYYFESTHRLKHKDGSYRWVLDRGLASRTEDGKAYRIAGSQTDITTTKLVESKLKNNETRMRSILDNVLEGIITTDDNSNIESINHVAEEILAVSQEDAIGKPLTDLIAESDRQVYQNQIQHIQEDKSQSSSASLITLAIHHGNKTFDLSITEMSLDGETKFINILKPSADIQSIKSA